MSPGVMPIEKLVEMIEGSDQDPRDLVGLVRQIQGDPPEGQVHVVGCRERRCLVRPALEAPLAAHRVVRAEERAPNVRRRFPWNGRLAVCGVSLSGDSAERRQKPEMPTGLIIESKPPASA